jgi:hypothetical protein
VKPTGREFAYGLAAVAALAFAVRVAAVFAIGSYRLEHVTYEHGEIARNLIEGRGFTVRWLGAEGPTSQQAPVYPILVAAFYGMFGVQTPMALLALQLFQALLGALLSMCVVLLGTELVGSRTWPAWLAGLGVALYPTLIYAATQVQVATVVSLLSIILLWTAARVARSASWVNAIVCGVIAAFLVLTDPIMVLVLIVAVLMIVCRRPNKSIAPHRSPKRQRGVGRNGPVLADGPSLAVGPSLARRATVVTAVSRAPGRTLLLASVTVAAFAGVVAPWIMRNYRVHGELVFVKSTFGYAFWQGNHPRSFGTDKIPLPRSAPGNEESQRRGLRALERSLWHTRLIDTLYIDDAVLANERIDELSGLSEPERSRRLFAEAIGYIAEHPGHYARLCLQRMRYFLLFDETNPKSRVGLYRASHLVLQLLAALGLWISGGDWKRLWPTYLVFVLVTMFHSLTIVSARFHLPLEPIQWLWAGFPCAMMLEDRTIERNIMKTKSWLKQFELKEHFLWLVRWRRDTKMP